MGKLKQYALFEEINLCEFPVRWEIKLDNGVGPNRRSKDELFSSLEKTLKTIDSEGRYEDSVTRKEFDAVFEGVLAVVQHMGLVFPGPGPKACHSFWIKVLTPICGTIVLEKIETTAEFTTKTILDVVNNPTKGKFTRRIEWSMEDTEDHRLFLVLNARPGYAIWLEKDKIRAEKEREIFEQESAARPKSVKELVKSIVARPKSVAEGLQFGMMVASHSIQSWAEGKSTDGSDSDDDGKSRSSRKSGKMRETISPEVVL